MDLEAKLPDGLLPCTFCGFDVPMMHSPSVGTLWRVGCPGCEAMGPERPSELDAAACWNGASENLTALQGEVDALRQQLTEAMDERDHILADWNAIVKASGSRTHGAAIGHVARLAAAKETAERELAGAREKYDELIMAVATKWPDESRHETALRYINEREQPNDNAARAAQTEGGEGMSAEPTRTELRRIADEFQSERDAAKRDAARAFDERDILLNRERTLRARLEAAEALRHRLADVEGAWSQEKSWREAAERGLAAAREDAERREAAEALLREIHGARFKNFDAKIDAHFARYGKD